ncbi:MAG TPA: hypothetical protein EYG71_00420 [Leucothrix sp.]|nr:hypothetical protein [Leucothrix sp.]
MIKNILIVILFLSLLSCNSTDKVRILKVNKVVYTGSQTDPLAKACSDWKLSLKDVEIIFMLSQEVQKEQLHRHFYHLSCEITGEALLNKKPISFVINAASHMRINTGDTSFYKGCNTKKCKPLFLMAPEDQS